MKYLLYRLLPIILLFQIVILPLSADAHSGANHAEAEIAAFMDTLGLESGKMHEFTDLQAFEIIDLSYRLEINIFELIDCTYRYTARRNTRISISGDSIRKLQPLYNLGNERIMKLLPISKVIKLEAGASLVPDQKALDVYLDSEYRADIEIGTAMYNKKFGFAKLQPLLFGDPYGVKVRVLIFTASLDQLKLYEPGKGAIYAKGISKPKRWHLGVITKVDD